MYRGGTLSISPQKDIGFRDPSIKLIGVKIQDNLAIAIDLPTSRTCISIGRLRPTIKSLAAPLASASSVGDAAG